MQSQIPAGKALDLWLDKPAPRYTSYPTAPFLNANVGANAYADSLLTLPAETAISLYIHVPFCRKLCLYCGCNTAVTQRDARVNLYLDSIKREASEIAELTGRREVSRLHFGGGTPSIMAAKAMQDLFAHLRQTFNMDVTNEIAMELDPRTLDRDKIAALSKCGINRVSLGIQDFDGAVQAAIQRIQPFEMVEQVCAWLHQNGIRGINFDLMYGLPRQNCETIAKTMRQVCRLAPSRIALFSYAHVPQMKKQQQALEVFGLPDAYLKLEMEGIARAILESSGYIPVGMDHFGLPGDPLAIAQKNNRLRRNFQGYTDDQTLTLIGLGASSISQTPDGLFQNEHDERSYHAKIDSGELATQRGILLSSEDRLRGAVIDRLMCSFACDLESISRQHGLTPDIFAAVLEALRPYQDAHLVAREGYRIRITTPHRMAVRVIAQLFDAYAKTRACASRAA